MKGFLVFSFLFSCCLASGLIRQTSSDDSNTFSVRGLYSDQNCTELVGYTYFRLPLNFDCTSLVRGCSEYDGAGSYASMLGCINATSLSDLTSSVQGLDATVQVGYKSNSSCTLDFSFVSDVNIYINDLCWMGTSYSCDSNTVNFATKNGCSDQGEPFNQTATTSACNSGQRSRQTTYAFDYECYFADGRYTVLDPSIPSTTGGGEVNPIPVAFSSGIFYFTDSKCTQILYGSFLVNSTDYSYCSTITECFPISDGTYIQSVCSNASTAEGLINQFGRGEPLVAFGIYNSANCNDLSLLSISRDSSCTSNVDKSTQYSCDSAGKVVTSMSYNSSNCGGDSDTTTQNTGCYSLLTFSSSAYCYNIGDVVSSTGNGAVTTTTKGSTSTGSVTSTTRSLTSTGSSTGSASTGSGKLVYLVKMLISTTAEITQDFFAKAVSAASSASSDRLVVVSFVDTDKNKRADHHYSTSFYFKDSTSGPSSKDLAYKFASLNGTSLGDVITVTSVNVDQTSIQDDPCATGCNVESSAVIIAINIVVAAFAMLLC